MEKFGPPDAFACVLGEPPQQGKLPRMECQPSSARHRVAMKQVEDHWADQPLPGQRACALADPHHPHCKFANPRERRQGIGETTGQHSCEGFGTIDPNGDQQEAVGLDAPVGVNASEAPVEEPQKVRASLRGAQFPTD